MLITFLAIKLTNQIFNQLNSNKLQNLPPRPRKLRNK